MGNLLNIVKRMDADLSRCEKSELSEEISRSHHSSAQYCPRGCSGWNTFMQRRSPEAQYILSQIRKAYSEGVPAQVPIAMCLLCGWNYPGVHCRFRDGLTGFLCVSCVVAETDPGVNRTICEICAATIQGSHNRTDPGGLIVCGRCWIRFSGASPDQVHGDRAPAMHTDE